MWRPGPGSRLCVLFLGRSVEHEGTMETWTLWEAGPLLSARARQSRHGLPSLSLLGGHCFLDTSASAGTPPLPPPTITTGTTRTTTATTTTTTTTTFFTPPTCRHQHSLAAALELSRLELGMAVLRSTRWLEALLSLTQYIGLIGPVAAMMLQPVFSRYAAPRGRCRPAIFRRA
ncbi:predicted protein [Plenodomus lingam JN3]|uniref:Predicted protein n=1 Tax=Leptosphaeria maculans (strain JN3 / isolate v23.1.3 / race Av1-4-5-6-7-8) TaxID=985895 RepID=E5A3A7_LEPMJ|nr:predicted protein [Plenodomus lingam JN3]CBX98120.1 predicted protein [Plenodomus lingam JN3]